MKTICVFCGARKGLDTEIAKLTYEIGQEIARNDMNMICGGSDCGLMGVVTDGVTSEGGQVVGIFPAILDDVEEVSVELTGLIRTPCLPSRKQKMVDMSDAFLILPGGYGTLDEIFEIVVLRRLNANQKPIMLFNYNGFYDFTLKQIDKMVLEGFIGENEANLLTIVSNIDELKAVIREGL